MGRASGGRVSHVFSLEGLLRSSRARMSFWISLVPS
jgi:hypothetical protein